MSKICHRRIYKILQKTKRGYKVIYVGMTSLPLMKRFWQHCEKWLGDLVLKHGLENFKIVTIRHCYGTYAEAIKLEKECSKHYRQFFNLLNKRDGQSFVTKSDNPFYGKKHNNESIEKIKKNGVFLKGKASPHYGKHMSKQAKEKLKKSLCRPVKCITTGEEFDSIEGAIAAYKRYHCGNIAMCCKGLRDYAGKLEDGTLLKWEFIR